jgi:SAM-dependent methyltransferase
MTDTIHSAPSAEMVAPLPIVCGLCGAQARLRLPRLNGYRAGTTFAIYECGECGSSFADPMQVDERIYEDIYRNAKDVLAYSRYAEFAETIGHTDDPLAYLADQEDVYWGVARALSERPAWNRVLEIGSGFGYLTYALSRRGYHVRGIDLSRAAVAGARARFGDLYESTDIASLRQRQDFEGWDAVVCTELIEHIPDPHEFLSAALSLLKPGGGLVGTTPNRSFYPSRLDWETDLPPVHLWWFSESSLARIAARHDCDLHLVDFTQYNRMHPRYVLMAATALSKASRIDEAGNSLIRPHKRSLAWRVARLALRLPGLGRIASLVTKRRRPSGPMAPTACFVLVPRA